MFDQIAGEQHPGLNPPAFHITHNFFTVYAFPHGHHKPKPARIAVRCSFRQNQLILHIAQCSTKVCPVLSAAFHKVRQFFQLFTANGCLHICNLQVITKMAVHIFVVVAFGQLPVLAVKTMAADVVPAGGTAAVPSPIPVGTDQAVKQWVTGVDAAAFSHRHMMWRVKAGGADVPNGAGFLRLPIEGVGAS